MLQCLNFIPFICDFQEQATDFVMLSKQADRNLWNIHYTVHLENGKMIRKSNKHLNYNKYKINGNISRLVFLFLTVSVPLFLYSLQLDNTIVLMTLIIK
jgi:hypothetical protein